MPDDLFVLDLVPFLRGANGEGGGSGPTTVPFSTIWTTSGQHDMGDHVVTGALAIVSDDTDSVVGGFTQGLLVSDGVHVPTFDGVPLPDYDLTEGARNGISLSRIGASKFWIVVAGGGTALAVPAAPVFASAPAIIGTPTIGVASAYTPGTVTGYPTPTRARQWTRDGVDISGAIGLQYTPVPGDAGHALRIRELATNASAPSGVASTSAPATVLAAPTGTAQFATSTYSVSEGIGTLAITVSRIGGSAGAASVDYATASGTATSGSDFTGATGTLNWPDGDAASKTFNITIIDDAVVESAETFTVNLSNPTGATLGSPSTTTITINDNDSGSSPVPVVFDLRGANVSETGTSPKIYGGNGSCAFTTADNMVCTTIGFDGDFEFRFKPLVDDGTNFTFGGLSTNATNDAYANWPVALAMVSSDGVSPAWTPFISGSGGTSAGGACTAGTTVARFKRVGSAWTVAVSDDNFSSSRAVSAFTGPTGRMFMKGSLYSSAQMTASQIGAT